MSVVFDLSGLYAKLDRMTADTAAVNTAAVTAGADIMSKSIKAEIEGAHAKNSKTGASAGGPPENVSGKLKGSVTSDIKVSGIRATALIGPTAFYGGFIENGRKKAPAFPFVKPGAEKSMPEVHEAMVAAWRAGFGW